MFEGNRLNKIGRPKAKVNIDTVKSLSKQGYGHKRIARILTENGEFVSASTVKRILRNIFTGSGK